MKKLEIKLKELKEMLIEDGYNDSNIVLQTIEDIQLEAINYTRCSTELKCGECECRPKYENIGCDTLKDCKKDW